MSWRVDWKASVGLLSTELKILVATMLLPLFVVVVYTEDIWVFALEQIDPDPDLGPREAGNRPNIGDPHLRD